jgi:hypothetical protein
MSRPTRATATGASSADGSCTLTLVQPDPPDLVAVGPPTLDEGTPCVLDLSCAEGNATIADWTVNWNDGPPDWSGNPTPDIETWTQGTGGWSCGSETSAGGPSHLYTTGDGLYTVSVSADSVDGGSYDAPNTVPVAVLPAAPSSLGASLTSPGMDAFPGRLYLTWSGGADNVVAEESTNNGASWTPVDDLEGNPVLGEVAAGWAEVDGLMPSTSYSFRIAALNAAGSSAWSNTASGATDSDTYESGSVTPLAMTAYRTGGNYGIAVTDADRLSDDPSNYVILVNDGYGDDPSGQYNNMQYHWNEILGTGTIDDAATDTNLAKIVFHEVPGCTDALITVSGVGARIYQADGTCLGWTDTENPTLHLGGSYIGGLSSGAVTIYVEGIAVNPDLVVKCTAGGESGEVHMAIADVCFVQPGSTTPITPQCGEDLAELDGATLYQELAYLDSRVMVPGLGSQQIAQLTVTPDGGAGAVEALTDNAAGTAEASLATFFDYEDGSSGGGSPLPPAYRLGVPDDGFVQVSLQTPGAKDVQTVKIATLGAWAEDHNWSQSATTGKYSGTATAKGGPASLQDLAALVTGEGSDWTALRDDPANAGLAIDPLTHRVPADTQVNIGSLLTLLEGRTRSAVVRDALCANKYAYFPTGPSTPVFAPPQNAWRAANIEYVFNTVAPTGPGEPAPPEPALDCFFMSLVVEAKGLIDTIGDAEYDALGGGLLNTAKGFMAMRSFLPLSSARAGDWLWFLNNPNYVTYHPHEAWSRENVIDVGALLSPVPTDFYWGWSSSPGAMSYTEWCNLLATEYNTGLPQGVPTINGGQVQGFTGEADFWVMAKVGMKVFDYRVVHPAS